MEAIKNQLEVMGYDYAVAIATKSVFFKSPLPLKQWKNFYWHSR